MEAIMRTRAIPHENIAAPRRLRIERDDSVKADDMHGISRSVVRHAHALAREVGAKAVLLLADAVENDEELGYVVETVDFHTILISRKRQTSSAAHAFPRNSDWITVPDVHMTRTGQVKMALVISIAKGLLERGDRVVCLTGIDRSGIIDTCMVLNLGTEPEMFSVADTVLLSGGVSPAVFERTLTLATQLATEGREGRPVGALFVIGDSKTVMAQSRSLVLNPFHGYPESGRNILDPNLEETIKEFSAIDGAFIINGDGVVLAAGVHLVPTATPPTLLKGLGTRHAAACAITASSAAVAIVISQSTGTISIFKSGEMITDIHRPTNGGRLMN